jgi:hypothetical protein
MDKDFELTNRNSDFKIVNQLYSTIVPLDIQKRNKIQFG